MRYNNLKTFSIHRINLKEAFFASLWFVGRKKIISAFLQEARCKILYPRGNIEWRHLFRQKEFG